MPSERAPRALELPSRGGLTAGSIDGQLVYAVGDVHGRYDLLLKMLERLAPEAARHAAGRRPILILCGDYVDRGPDSGRVLAALVRLRERRDWDVRLLMGNHEEGLLDYIGDPVRGRAWLGFGGVETLASYGVQAPDEDAEPAAHRAARAALLDAMPASHLVLLRSLELIVTIGDYAFCHAGVRPGRPLTRQTRADLLWIRSAFLDHDKPLDKKIVHGHSWIGRDPSHAAHRIGIDTGAYETGVLTAVRLEDGLIDFVQVEGPPGHWSPPGGHDTALQPS